MPAIIDGTNGVTTPNVLTSSSGVALTLQSGGTTAVTIDTSQNVLVGTTSLYGGEKLAMLQSTNNRGFVIQQTNASNTSPPFLIDASRNTTNNTYNAIAYYNSGAGAYKFQVADSGSIATAGSVGLGTATPPNNGIGIAFPATQSASSDANTLDDYEEGTFTPTMGPSSGSWNGASAKGFYTKIGNVVCIQMYLTITDVGTASGTVAYSGLPFSAMNPSTGGGNRASVGLVREDAVTGVLYQLYVTGGGTSGASQSLTGGGITQANGYVYDWIVTYRTS